MKRKRKEEGNNGLKVNIELEKRKNKVVKHHQLRCHLLHHQRVPLVRQQEKNKLQQHKKGKDRGRENKVMAIFFHHHRVLHPQHHQYLHRQTSHLCHAQQFQPHPRPTIQCHNLPVPNFHRQKVTVE